MKKGKGGEKHEYQKSAQVAPDHYNDSEGVIANGSCHEADNASHTSEDFDWEKPPAYEFRGSGPNIETSVVAQDDGRVAINFIATEKLPIPIPAKPNSYTPPNITNSKSPFLNIVIQIVGSRGDIQPFIALGSALRTAGHRVRIATHDVFQDFVKATGLEFFPIGGDPASLMAYMVKNPGIIPKFETFMSDVCGFFFRGEPDYTPDAELDNFLRSGPPPVYIGFGSIVLDSPEKLTNILIEAVRACGTRAIISRGWKWLFKHVSCVVHHGGAGTTACGLLNGRPTAIVPFFGDQAFWGQMIAAAGAGPLPIHHKSLNQGNLTEAIQYCLTTAAMSAAVEISQRMRQESGVQRAVQSFHTNLSVDTLRCDILLNQAAVWQYSSKSKNGPKKTIKLSDEAAFILVEHKKIDPKLLKLYQPKPISIENFRWDPVSAGTQVLLSTMTDFTIGFSEIFTGPANAFRSKENGGGGREAAKTFGKGFGKMVGVVPKATLVDFPLALTEGLHHMPRLYGDEVRGHGKVKDWKSGGVVAGKNFGYGFMDGLSGTITKPYKGAKEGGWAGFGKGVAKGAMGLVTGPASGMFGLLAYPFLGMYKSIATSSLSRTEKKIILARQVYGSYMARERERKNERGGDGGEGMVLAGWERLKISDSKLHMNERV
ncbi:hypothetical protein SS1G_04910 [Sclerotinia sclerotiorum 1980 UF-70]|uniref:Uncharacterized protein n=1 Tax=Sclerotinia sclerotiorum (strain ATCC 18683 / 1980 / Ss-1) TaxID=665079 RepID=A7EHW8_SCLS1|nr:hypothetical protein SS1G_04910 [Sclerotinia sclerotiorum 1980 UF-70]EDO02434.1 hypothetical protein SS1G_04910 [Sclerotinia sclerotiorum 1980 UF-70]